MSPRPVGEQRPPLYLLTGLVLGLALGLVYAWLIQPAQYRDAAPDLLPVEMKDQYRRMIALAYTVNRDVGRAQARLELLGDADPAGALANLSEQLVAGDGSGDEARALSVLAAALRNQPTAAPTEVARSPQPARTMGVDQKTTPAKTLPAIKTATPAIPPTATSTPDATFTPRPSATLSPTPGAPFAVAESSSVCEGGPPGLMTIVVEDAAGQAVAGVQVVVQWGGQKDVFFTGLAPDISPGYADFVMTPATVYSVYAGEGGEAVGGLSAPQCTRPDGSTYWGGISLRFRQ